MKKTINKEKSECNEIEKGINEQKELITNLSSEIKKSLEDAEGINSIEVKGNINLIEIGKSKLKEIKESLLNKNELLSTIEGKNKERFNKIEEIEKSLIDNNNLSILKITVKITLEGFQKEIELNKKLMESNKKSMLLEDKKQEITEILKEFEIIKNLIEEMKSLSDGIYKKNNNNIYNNKRLINEFE